MGRADRAVRRSTAVNTNRADHAALPPLCVPTAMSVIRPFHAGATRRVPPPPARAPPILPEAVETEFMGMRINAHDLRARSGCCRGCQPFASASARSAEFETGAAARSAHGVPSASRRPRRRGDERHRRRRRTGQLRTSAPAVRTRPGNRPNPAVARLGQAHRLRPTRNPAACRIGDAGSSNWRFDSEYGLSEIGRPAHYRKLIAGAGTMRPEGGNVLGEAEIADTAVCAAAQACGKTGAAKPTAALAPGEPGKAGHRGGCLRVPQALSVLNVAGIKQQPRHNASGIGEPRPGCLAASSVRPPRRAACRAASSVRRNSALRFTSASGAAALSDQQPRAVSAIATTPVQSMPGLRHLLLRGRAILAWRIPRSNRCDGRPVRRSGLVWQDRPGR